MLKFLRPAPVATRTEPVPTRKGPEAMPDLPTNADKARVLMAMLEQGGDPVSAGIAPERLRDWARDLVETVERRREVGDAGAARSFVQPAPAARPSGLFRAPAPTLRPSPDDGLAPPPSGGAVPLGPAIAPGIRSNPVPAGTSPTVTLAAAAAFRAAPVASETSMPTPHLAEALVASGAPRIGAMARDELRRLIDATTDPESLEREHPAIIAMTLVGKPTLDQAAAMRRLPGGQVRAVHRALRAMEGTAG